MNSQSAFPDSASASYRTVSLSKIADVFTDGDWIETKDQAEAGIRLVQTGNVGCGEFKDRRDKARFIDEATFDRLKCFEVVPGDILISRLPDPVGRACIVPDTGQKMITAVDCSIVRVRPGAIDPHFLTYYTQTDQYLGEVDQRCTGTTRRRISRGNLGKVSVPLPSVAEQKRIVAVLDRAFAALDRARANAEANLADASTLFDSWISSAFKLGADNWPITTLPKISKNLDRSRVPIAKRDRESGGIPYYGASGIVDHVSDFIFEEDLLLISEDGANLLARAYPIAFSISGKSWVNNHAHVLRFNDATLQEFVRLYLNTISLEPYVSGMAQPKLNQRLLNAIPMPYPGLHDCARIVAGAEEMRVNADAARKNYDEQLTDIAALRQSLLQKAFAGELI